MQFLSNRRHSVSSYCVVIVLSLLLLLLLFVLEYHLVSHRNCLPCDYDTACRRSSSMLSTLRIMMHLVVNFYLTVLLVHGRPPVKLIKSDKTQIPTGWTVNFHLTRHKNVITSLSCLLFLPPW